MDAAELPPAAAHRDDAAPLDIHRDIDLRYQEKSFSEWVAVMDSPVHRYKLSLARMGVGSPVIAHARARFWGPTRRNRVDNSWRFPAVLWFGQVHARAYHKA